MSKSLAISYAMKRKKKKMADGGEVKQPTPPPKIANPDKLQSAQDSMRKAFKFAKGGHVKGVHKSDMEIEHPKNKMEKSWAGESQAGQGLRISEINDSGMQKAYEKHGKVLAEMKSMRKPNLKGLAHGGFLDEEMASGYHDMPMEHEIMNHAAMSEDDRKLNQHHVMAMDSQEQDIVDRIMMKRSQDFAGLARLSRGGMVANDVGTGQEADKLPNQYDDLVLRDDLESSYGDDNNSGDASGNAQEDEDRKDIVARIMASRRKKDRMPNPA